MAVKIGSARIDERGKISGGRAGDQGGEVSTQAWYRHSKGWRTFRAKDAARAERIARCMELACASPHIGYDQGQRNGLYDALKGKNFDIARLDRDVETDCSALVRFCCASAGIALPDFSTSGEAAALLRSGAFFELEGDRYTAREDYLRRGDIQVTRTKGHTVVVLTDGPGAGNEPGGRSYTLGERVLRSGMEGPDVKELQMELIQLGYSCGDYGADGEFGDGTELAVRAFQDAQACEVDGEVGPETLEALQRALGGDGEAGGVVQIVGGKCWVRVRPAVDAEALGVAREGSRWKYGGQTSVDGWLLIERERARGWVSGRYGRLVD